ncbi:MAG TPA: site-2 protease family protein [Caulobacter sp.]|nr:site-2 protease family protein [Caulobacter sp.]
MRYVDQHPHGGFRIFGIEIRVRLSWLILALLLAWSLASGAFPEIYQGLPGRSYWTMAVLAVAGLGLSIILHELAHSLVARAFGLPIDRITLFLLGGVAELREEPRTPWSELLMAAAGPAFSVVFGLALGVLSRGVPPETDTLGLAAALDFLASVNLVLAAFNMAPAFPMDGGRVLRAVIWLVTGNPARATRIAAAIGGFLALALILAGVALALTGQIAAGLWWVLIGLFLRTAAHASVSDLLAQRLLTGVPVREVMALGAGPLPGHMTVAEFVRRQAYAPPQSLRAVVKDGVAVGVIEAADVLATPRQTWPDRTLARTCRPIGEAVAVDADADAFAVFERMKRDRRLRLLVLLRDRPVGVLSLQDLMQRLELARRFETDDAPGRSTRPGMAASTSGASGKNWLGN